MPHLIAKLKSYCIRHFTFPSENDIAADLIATMSDEQIEGLRRNAFDDLILLHHTFGRFIRNRYRLWDPKNPHTRYSDGDDESHPDNLSYRVIQLVWHYFNDPKKYQS